MANESNFWQLWAPYLNYLEDNHLDLRTIKALAETISSPVLVVGGGQGLLVNELQKQGLKVNGVDSSSEMVKLAKQRRGVELILTNGSTLPFPDRSFKTTVVATGVIDFMDDEKLIGQLISEIERVTETGGKLMISFYRVHPVTEKFLQRLGIITGNGVLRRRKVFEMSRLEPKDSIALIRKEGRMGLVAALIEILKLQFLLPEQEKLLSKNLSKILKAANNADELVASVSEAIPYRGREQIESMFKKLDKTIVEFLEFDSCYVVTITV